MAPGTIFEEDETIPTRARNKFSGSSAEEDSGVTRLLSQDLLVELDRSGSTDAEVEVDLVHQEDGFHTTTGSENGSMGTGVAASLTPALTTPNASPPLAPWDWKTDAPEFVPGEISMSALLGAMSLLPPTMAASSAGMGGLEGSGVFSDRALNLARLLPHSPPPAIKEELEASDSQMCAEAGSDLFAGSNPDMSPDHQAQFLAQAAQLEFTDDEREELRMLQDQVSTLRRQRDEMQRDWDEERQGLLRELNRFAALMNRYSIPFEEASIDDPVLAALMDSSHLTSASSEAAKSPMDPGKTEEVNHRGIASLFAYAAGKMQAKEVCNAAMDVAMADCAMPRLPPDFQGEGRRLGALADPMVNRMAQSLEALTESSIDERALRALQALSPADGMEVFRKVEDLVQQQGGRCRNLSSILQSVCRKRERRSARNSNGTTGATGGKGQALGGWPIDPMSLQLYAEAPSQFLSQQDLHQDPSQGLVGPPPGLEGFCGEEDGSPTGLGTNDVTDVTTGTEAEAAEVGSQRCAAKVKQNPHEDDYWTEERISEVAQQGFEMKQRGDRWTLTLRMSSLSPPFGSSAMERYCRWLWARLTSFQNEHGAQALRTCSGEIDFGGSGLGNQAVWLLLETLVKCEVHTAVLKLHKNRISEGGVLALCEFLRTNRRAGPVYELHLSENEIDDESALELLRTIHAQRPRYPPRKANRSKGDGSPGGPTEQVPVCVRLDGNMIKDEKEFLSTLDAGGITYCSAQGRPNGWPGAWGRSECPLLQLCLSTDQVGPTLDEAVSGAATGDVEG